MRHFMPTETLTEEELAEVFVEKNMVLAWLARRYSSDRGSQFISTFWRAISQRLGTMLEPSSAYHPETNGQMERINAEVE
ncbi:hypothetical protein K3495_g7459 [Podosphaera aphanis]|nr:hypothetical protein K3495_g7459 [Podosphaera aphanis]